MSACRSEKARTRSGVEGLDLVGPRVQERRDPRLAASFGWPHRVTRHADHAIALAEQVENLGRFLGQAHDARRVRHGAHCTGTDLARNCVVGLTVAVLIALMLATFQHSRSRNVNADRNSRGPAHGSGTLCTRARMSQPFPASAPLAAERERHACAYHDHSSFACSPVWRVPLFWPRGSTRVLAETARRPKARSIRTSCRSTPTTTCCCSTTP